MKGKTMTVEELIKKSEEQLTKQFALADEISEYNQEKVLKAFNKHLDVISGSDFLDPVADNLFSLNTIKQIKTFGYGIDWLWECY